MSRDLNACFDGIFCINLSRQPERWRKVSERFNRHRIDVQRFDATDGNSAAVRREWSLIKSKLMNAHGPDSFLERKKLSALGIIENEFAYGALCSHIRLITEAKTRGLKRVLIFEDDVVFHKNFDSNIQLINDINWKLLYLGASQYEWRDIRVQGGFYLARKSFGGFAYAVDESLFDDILESALKRERSFDNVLCTSIQTRFSGSCFVMYPNSVIADVRESDLRGARDLKEHSSQMRWDLELYEI